MEVAGAWVWLELPEPWTPGAFAQSMKQQGLEVWPSEVFTVGRSSAPPCVRVSLGGAFSRNQLQAALGALAGQLRTHPTPVHG